MKEELEEQVREIVDTTTLTRREAEVYVLRTEEDMTHREISDELGISEGNAGSKWAAVRHKSDQAEERIEVLKNTADLIPPEE